MKHFILFFIGISILSGCLKNNELTYHEKRLVGKWFYSEVEYRERWGSLKKHSLSNDYIGSFFMLKDDFTVTYYDKLKESNYSGQWELVESYNEDDSENVLILSLANDLTHEVKQLIFENTNVVRRKITAHYRTNEEIFYFKLVQ